VSISSEKSPEPEVKKSSIGKRRGCETARGAKPLLYCRRPGQREEEETGSSAATFLSESSREERVLGSLRKKKKWNIFEGRSKLDDRKKKRSRPAVSSSLIRSLRGETELPHTYSRQGRIKAIKKVTIREKGEGRRRCGP